MTLSLRALQQSAKERVAPLKVLSDDGRSPITSLLVHEIYVSVQGEGTRAGVLCTFVRLTGCHLRCAWCDTEHAFDDGNIRTVTSVVDEVSALGVPHVQLTGGEPLLQKAARPLMNALADRGHTVLLETSGGVTTDDVDARVVTILDVKTPSSGEVERNVWSNFDRLRAHDEIKFVVADDVDYAFSRKIVDDHALATKATVLFSPVAGVCDPAWLAQKIVDDRLPVRFQMQLHKILWGEKRGV